MKKLLAIAALSAAAFAAPALAQVNISIGLGEPGFYGQLDLGGFGRPSLVYREPIVVVQRYRQAAPVYLRVPREHVLRWSRYCGRYDACARPVYFVRDDWYRGVYVPKYRTMNERRWHDARHDRRDHRWDGRHDRGYDRRDNRRDDRGRRR